jgi:WD40 repeat protein
MIRSLAFSRDGTYLVTSSYGALSGRNELKVWDMKTGGEPRRLLRQLDELTSVRFTPDGKAILAVSASKRVLVLDAATGQTLASIPGPSSGINSLSLSSDGGTLALACGEMLASGPAAKGEVILLKFANLGRDAAAGQQSLRSDAAAAIRVSFSPDGQLLAAGLADGSVTFWDALGHAQRTIGAHQSDVLSVAFSPDGKRLATGSRDATVAIWDVASGKELLRLPGHNRMIFALEFSPDGRLLASGSGLYKLSPKEKRPPVKDQGELVLWDSASGRVIRAIDADLNLVQTLAFSPDGAAVVWGGNRERLMLLPLESK